MNRIAVLIVVAVASTIHRASADDFQFGKPLATDQIFARCPTQHGDLVTAICLGHQIDQLRRLLRARFEQGAAEIDRAAARPAGPGMVGGEKAAEWKRAFVAAQEAWKQYDTRECENVSAYDHAGGSAAGLFQQACQIRHLVLRVNELASP